MKDLNTWKSQARPSSNILTLTSLAFFKEQKASWGYMKSHSHFTKSYSLAGNALPTYESVDFLVIVDELHLRWC